jgi:hypothetical protein
MSNPRLADTEPADPLVRFNLICDRAIEMLQLLLDQIAVSRVQAPGRLES